MNMGDRLAEKINQLTPENLQYMAKLVCLCRFCPGFSEELGQIVPAGGEKVSLKQLEATDALMNKWLNDEGWAEILRPELESVGVSV